MKTLFRSLLLLMLIRSVVWADALTNADIVKMHDAEIAEATILLAIEANSPDYDTQVDALIALKEAGLAEQIIQAMLARQFAPEGSADPEGFFAQDFPSIAPPIVDPAKGGMYYLRCGVHFEGGTSLGTNYARGELLPINTKVTVRALKKKKLLLETVPAGRKLEVVNVPGYTLKTMPELAGLLLSSEPTPLDQWPADLAQSIREGVLRKGMTKEQVLMARGYPPAHRTPSIGEQRWTYWDSRLGQKSIFFNEQERLADGQDIY